MTNPSFQPLDFKRITVRIEGETALVCPSITRADEFLTPEQEFQRSLFPIGQNRWGFPQDRIFAALTTANGGGLFDVKLTGGPLLEITGSQPIMRRDRKDGDPNHPVICRAQFFPWQLTVTAMYNSAKISLQDLLHLFRRAGFEVGIGSMRPERYGNCGTFRVKNIMTHGEAGEISEQMLA